MKGRWRRYAAWKENSRTDGNLRHSFKSAQQSRLQQKLDSIADAEQRRENAKSRLDDIYTIPDGMKNRPMEYDDQIVRQLLECIVVDSKEQVTVIFKGGLKSVQPLTEWQRLTSAPNLESSRFFVREQIPT